MTQEDYKIREGLIALLCVGDPFNVLYTNVSHFNINSKLHVTVNIVETFTINAIGEKEIELISHVAPDNGCFNQSLYFADEYNGQLFGWSTMGWYQDNEYEKRIERLVKAIESSTTVWLDKR
jgi:hypothetical protein